jgi:hypothetical protein
MAQRGHYRLAGSLWGNGDNCGLRRGGLRFEGWAVVDAPLQNQNRADPRASLPRCAEDADGF